LQLDRGHPEDRLFVPQGWPSVLVFSCLLCISGSGPRLARQMQPKDSPFVPNQNNDDQVKGRQHDQADRVGVIEWVEEYR
jgi:hypothetical protein